MTESYYFNCKHEQYQSEDYCHKCGGIFISMKNIYALKPNKYKLCIEISPKEIFEQMKLNSNLQNHNIIPFEKTNNISDNTPNKKSTSYSNKRKLILKRIKNMINKFKFKDRTFHLTIYLMDYIIYRCITAEDKGIISDHIAIGCLALSSKNNIYNYLVKFNEMDPTIPDLSFFQIMFENIYYKMAEIKSFELFCLRKLNSKLDYITPLNFIQIFISNGILFSEDIKIAKENKNCFEINNFSRIYVFVNEIIDFTMESN
jgi:hypothetical protein